MRSFRTVLALFNFVLLMSLGAEAAYCEVSNSGNEKHTWPAEQSSVHASLPTYEWNNSSAEPQGVVVVVHGTTRHGTAFETTALHLVDRGFRVVALDLRGHGDWYFGTRAGNRGRTINYTESSEDLAELLQRLRKQYPRIPMFCIGESVGSAVVVTTASTHSDLMDGIVLVSPGTRPRVYNLFLVIRDFLKGITKLDRQLDVSPYIARYASNDGRIVDEMLRDPRSRNKLSGRELLRTSLFLRGIPRLSPKLGKNLPILMVQGSKDHIVSISSAKRMWRRLPSSDKTILEVPYSGHVLLQTAFVKPSVLEPVADWLSERTKSRAGVLAQPGATLKAQSLTSASEVTR